MKKQSRKVSKMARNTAIALFTCLTFACSGGSTPAATGTPMPAKTPAATATAAPDATGTPAATPEGEATPAETPSGHIQSNWTLLGFGAPW